MTGISSSQRLTSIPISESVEFQLAKLMKEEKSYSSVIQNLITNYWKHSGKWNKSNTKVGQSVLGWTPGQTYTTQNFGDEILDFSSR
jgi:predicted CopG family antitoxin